MSVDDSKLLVRARFFLITHLSVLPNGY